MTVSKTVRTAAIVLAAAIFSAACTTQASRSEYFGKTEPLPDQTLRYISGSETESLDPQVGTSQPDARIYMALYDGLTEYHPKTMEPTPALAERWTVNPNSTEFTFFLRKGAKWSNGDPITANDFVYTFRRGLSPELASRNAYLAYYIKYGQAYNEGDVFVRDPKTGQFLTEEGAAPEAKAANEAAAVEPPTPTKATKAAETDATEPAPTVKTEEAVPDTEFSKTMRGPLRLVLPGDEKARAKKLDGNPKLKAQVEGKELVPVKAEDIGVEAVDDHTLRVTLVQPAPYFLGLTPHQWFRVLHLPTIEKHGTQWTTPQNIVVSGAFTLEAQRPYNEIVVRKNPQYWDAAIVRLNRIIFYPLQDNTTKMNLYKAGEVDALSNHTVPAAWLDLIKPLKDYMNAPEVAIEYYSFNTKTGPTADKRVRRALNMAIDKVALAKWKKIVLPLTAFTPEGIFPGYPQPKGDEFNPERAKQFLADAGYKDASGKYDPRKVPVSEIELTYNPDGGNAQLAEFIQAQWKQNLGITIPLKSIEFRTFLQQRSRVEFKGIARNGWVGDYMDPYTFLALMTKDGEGGTGWVNPEYDRMLNEANAAPTAEKRYELLAKAEAFMLEEQPAIPLMTNAVNAMKKPYVKGLEPNPGTMHAWKYVYIEYDRSKWDGSASDMND
ncbi:MAG TPA: peptide ABC transporter substrate-binding protein [Pyrinomonadaceae bacterium]|nr:peptide ABC transporter substrate-binding protein [Pyrinomonadaceae bacterium]